MDKNKKPKIKVFRILRKPKEFVDGLTMKLALFYLVIFSMMIVFLLGFILGAIIL
jgi:hypothetical protein